jgi:hypothetical protein
MRINYNQLYIYYNKLNLDATYVSSSTLET